jgi:hypothetical protein
MSDTKASIFGKAQFWDPDEGVGTRPQPVPFAGAKVTATGLAGRFSVVTGADGLFDLRVPVGEYDLAAEVLSGKYTDLWFPRTALSDPRACAETGVSVHSDGRLSGRVVDARGRPVAGVTVEVGAKPAVESLSFTPRHAARTAADGTFTISKIPPGEYEVGLNLRRGGALSMYPRVVYSPKNAQVPSVLRLDASARLNIGDFIVPPAVDLVPISGVVRREDGNSPEGATIRLAVPSDAYTFVGEPVVADASGKFTFAGIAGYSYGLMVEFRYIDPTTGVQRFIRTDETVLTASRGSQPIALILRVPR